MFITVSGISGSGKTTLIKDAMKSDKQLFIPPSVVTRGKRIDDNPNNYIYLSQYDFKKGIVEDRFLEYQEYRGNYYGFLKESYEKIINNNCIAIRDIAYEGIISIKKIIPVAPNILIMTDFDLIYERLLKRGDNADSINERINLLEEEVETLKQIADYVVYNNGTFDESSEHFKSIIKSLKKQKRF